MIFFVLSTLGAHAQTGGAIIGTSEEADVNFRLGIKAYEEYRYDTALQHMLLSHRLAPDETVIFNIAAIYEATERYRDAFNAYAAYTATERVPEERLAVAKEAMERLAPKLALVDIASEPAGARVFIERKSLGLRGTTPLTLALEPGIQLVILEFDGRRQNDTQALLKIGAVKEVVLEMKHILVDVVVSGGPSGARVRNLDAPDADYALGETFQVPSGACTLEVAKEGYVAKRIPVEAVEGQVGRFKVKLTQKSDPSKKGSKDNKR